MIACELLTKVTSKIRSIDELTELMLHQKAEGKKVVHCHGVFDLLHIGHIRHFNQAKALGDVLIVTLTPDIYVNKGPHRPAFSENLRVEAIASLDCVDYVAVNRWPTAVQAIQIIRPDFYVKGPDYKDAEKDRTGGIQMEEFAVKSVGGQIAFTQDITFSSSTLINQHLSVFPKEVTDYLADLRARYSPEEVLRYLEEARALKVLVVGEAIIDDYHYCEAIGKSSKEPMLAIKHISSEKFAGGILAVANHVANFCDTVGMITFLGADNSHEEFIRERVNSRIKNIYLYRKNSPTIVKRRFIDNYFFTKLLEVYEINDRILDDADNEIFCDMLNAQIPRYDLVIVADFGHSMFTQGAIDILCSKARLLAVNAQSNAGNLGYHAISKYPRADYISIAENEVRLEARDRRGDLKAIVMELAQKLSCGRIVVTRGRNGCLVYSKDEGFFEIPAFASQVVDRMGAGDTFLAITALCVAQKAPMELTGFIGNAVGAQAVATVGNRKAIEPVPLSKHIESLLK